MKAFLLLAFGLFSLNCFAQGIRIVGVYAEIKYPGNIAVDENGKPRKSGPDSSFTMIVEAGKESLKWGYAYYNHQAYTVISKPVSKYSVKTKESGKQITLRPRKGKQLYQLELVPYLAAKRIPDTLEHNNFMIEARYGKYSYRLVKSGFIEIDTPPSV